MNRTVCRTAGEPETVEQRHERIRAAVCRIPTGFVASYGDVASIAGMPGRARLVGRVLRDSPAARELPLPLFAAGESLACEDAEDDEAGGTLNISDALSILHYLLETGRFPRRRGRGGWRRPVARPLAPVRRCQSLRGIIRCGTPPPTTRSTDHAATGERAPGGSASWLAR